MEGLITTTQLKITHTNTYQYRGPHGSASLTRLPVEQPPTLTLLSRNYCSSTKSRIYYQGGRPVTVLDCQDLHGLAIINN